MRRWRDTPDWWMPARAIRSLTCVSPWRSASTMRRRVGSARAWNASSCIAVYMHTRACHQASSLLRVRSRLRPAGQQDDQVEDAQNVEDLDRVVHELLIGHAPQQSNVR